MWLHLSEISGFHLSQELSVFQYKSKKIPESRLIEQATPHHVFAFAFSKKGNPGNFKCLTVSSNILYA
jgi:hypothetical protein